MPDLDGPIDPSFDHPFIHNEHDAIMRTKVDLTHLTADQQHKVYNLIREFWPVFDDRGVFVTVKTTNASSTPVLHAPSPSRRSFTVNEKPSS
jgi:hypothetical protein